MRRLLYLVPLGLFVALLGWFAIGLTLNPRDLPSALIDRPVPAFELPAVQEGGKDLRTEDIKGKVALINVFASWCAPCRIEHPVLMHIAQSTRVPLYGVDWKDKPGAGAAWLAQHGNPYTRVGDDAAGRAAIELGVTGAPETFVVDRQGRIRYKHTGPITGEVWRKTLLPLIRKLQNDENDSGTAARGSGPAR